MHGHFLILSTANRLSQKEQTRVGEVGGGGAETVVASSSFLGCCFEVFIVGNTFTLCSLLLLMMSVQKNVKKRKN